MLIFFAIVLFFGFIWLVSNDKPKSKTTSRPSSPSMVKSSSSNNDPLIYKKNQIRRFELKGLSFRKLDKEKDTGLFFGYAEVDLGNEYDQYAVAIYSHTGNLLGYTPKNNKRLQNSMLRWRGGKAPAWGEIEYNSNSDWWDGYVDIYVSFDDKKTDQYDKVISLMAQNQWVFKRDAKSGIDLLGVLEREGEIRSILKSLDNPWQFKYRMPSLYIPSATKSMEENEDWVNLLKLKEYEAVTSEMSKRYRDTLLRRIKKAERYMNPNKDN